MPLPDDLNLADTQLARLCREQGAKIDELQASLILARMKLKAYFKMTNGEYPGGPVYFNLMRRIDRALDNLI